MTNPYQYGEAEAIALPASSGVVIDKPCRYLGFAFRETGGGKLVGTDPAAAGEVSETVPAGKTWGLLAVRVQLVQGLTQTPTPTLVIDDGTDVLFQCPAFTDATGQPVSTTATYTWGVGLHPTARMGATPNIYAFAPLPADMELKPNYRVRTVTIGSGANTNYGAPVLWLGNSDASVVLYDNDSAASGTILDDVRVSSKNDDGAAYEQPGRAATNGIYAEISGGGTVEGSIFVSRV